MPKKITLADVAQAAGVSVATVSRVARQSVRVSPEIEGRVRSTALKMGLNLSEHRNVKIAGFLLGNRRILHSFHSRVLLGAEEYFAAHNYNLMFLSLKYDTNVDSQDLNMPPILQHRGLVCGYILAARISSNLLQFVKQRGIPSVVLGNHVQGDWQANQYDVLWFDDIQGASEVTRYLQSLGHHHIWFVGNRRLPWGSRRYEGYRRVMVEAGLSPQVSEINSSEYFELGYLSAKSLLNSGKPVTAIFAASDLIAQGVYRGLTDCNMHIPNNISVIGFDDIEAALLHPPLTTVRVFADQIGRQLAEMLLNRIANPDLSPQHQIIPTQMIRRESHRSISSESQIESPAYDQTDQMHSRETEC